MNAQTSLVILEMATLGRILMPLTLLQIVLKRKPNLSLYIYIYISQVYHGGPPHSCGTANCRQLKVGTGGAFGSCVGVLLLFLVLGW